MAEMSENRWSDKITTSDGDYVGVDEADAEVERLRADVAARDFEIETLGDENERLAEMLAKGVYIESASLKPEHYDIRTRGTGAMLLAEKLVMFFKASGGENFVTSTIEMEFADPKERERYALTIQKLDGEDSPAEKMQRQAEEIASLREALEPFAKAADTADYLDTDWLNIPAEMLSQARTALEKGGEDGD